MHAVGQVSAVGQVHGQDGVAGPQQRHIDGHVGLRSCVRLDVGMLRAEELLGAVAGQRFDDVDVFAAAVVTSAGVAFGVLVGENRASGLEDGRAGVVFGGDQFEAVGLATLLGLDSGEDVGIDSGEGSDRIHTELRETRANWTEERL